MDLKTKIVNTDFDRLLTKMGYAYFRNGTYNMNIIGVRSNERKNNNIFDDYIIVEYRNSDGNKCQYIFQATTNPGVYYLKHPMAPNGCAILVPGQYRGCWTIGRHKNKYVALVQCKPIKVYRDNNKDDILDCTNSPVEEGIFGVNIHKAGANSKYVDNWSAGCQVLKKANDFDIFMAVCNMQVHAGLGDKFTYTLINEKDLELF